MSWIVQFLLNNQETIKEEGDIESDQFNDLMLVEKAIETMLKENLISDADVLVLKLYNTVSLSSNMDGKDRGNIPDRHTLAKKYPIICTKIAEFLGDYFTDSGYLNYMKEKYNLDDAQMDVLKGYMKSEREHKYKTMRKVSSNGYKR